MVDFEHYFRHASACVGSLIPAGVHPECVCIDCRENEALNAIQRTRFDDESHQKDVWEDEQYMICPPRVLGYVLRDKHWAQLQVTLLETIPAEDPHDSWSKLKLADGEETKKMILQLVKGHGTSDKDLEVNDIIAKKGKGLVILLYGTTTLTTK